MILYHYYLIYMGIHAFQLSVCFYKLYTIGILPLNASDWIELVPYHQVANLN